ncbi:NAD-dependent deacetylase [Candidatus Riflebacteria bacterium]
MNLRQFDNEFQQAVEKIRDAEALLICTGAGMGVDSGLPDFRGNEGFWKSYPAFRKQNLSFVDMANPRWFEDAPQRAWAFYGHRLNLYRHTRPHPGFLILKNWAEKMQSSYFVFTSNVDGQFQKAGYPEEKILECHGSIHHLQCRSWNCNRKIWPAQMDDIDIDEEEFYARPPLPECPECGGVARPNILMFGDFGWLATRTEEQHYRYESWLKKINREKLVVVECGAGTAVPTVRYQSQRFSNLVRINPREPSVPQGQVSLPLGALESLKEIDELLQK